MLHKPFSSWTRQGLADHLKTMFKVELSDSTVGRHLRRLGWSLVRPALFVRSPDPGYSSKANQLERLKEQAKRGEIVLLFEDEVDLNLLPGVIRCWTRSGEQRKVQTPGTNQKRYGFGALNYTDGSLVTHLSDHKDSSGFIALIDAVVQRYCKAEVYSDPKVVIVLDNYGVHKSKRSQETLARYADRLEVFHLPTYSPKLNLIELVWKHLRARVTHNHLFKSIDSLIEAVELFFSNLTENPTRVLSIIGNHPNKQKQPIPSNLCSTT